MRKEKKEKELFRLSHLITVIILYQHQIFDIFRPQLGWHALTGGLHGMGGIDYAAQCFAIDTVEIEKVPDA